VVSPVANTYEKHPITDHVSSSQPCPIANLGELSIVTIIDAGHTTSYALSSGVTEPNLTKFLRSVQKSLLVNRLQSKL